MSRHRPFVVKEADELPFTLPEQVTIALGELAGAAKRGLLAFSVGLGLATMNELMDAEITELVGPRGKHDPERVAYRHGKKDPRQLTLGGRRVEVAKPRARTTTGQEVELETYKFFASRDLLTEAALDRMLNLLSARRYRHGLEPVGEVRPLATGKSAVSQRFVAGTARKLQELMSRDLSQLDLLAMFIDGINTGEHTIVVAMGIDAEGKKHPLGLQEGSSENQTVCRGLLNNLIKRGLDPELARLYVIDGGKGVRAALKACFGKYALIQRCRKHKREDVLGYLPKDQQAFIARKLDQAWRNPDADGALADLRALAEQLHRDHPGAAGSVREGLEETLTVSRLHLSPSLTRTLKSTNPVESMISVVRTTTGNVKRWRDGSMAERWTAAGMLEAEKRFRRINGCRDLQMLRVALNAHQATVNDEHSVQPLVAGAT
ncbi:MAG: IS256 family transposase [Candidatus Dormibacteraceae bacterium]